MFPGLQEPVWLLVHEAQPLWIQMATTIQLRLSQTLRDIDRDTWTKRLDISFKQWVASWPLLIGGCKTGTLSRRLFNLFLLKLNAIPNCNRKSLQDFGCFDVSMYHVSCKLLCEYYYIKTVITKSAMYHNFKKTFKVFLYHSIRKSVFSVQSFAFCRPMC